MERELEGRGIKGSGSAPHFPIPFTTFLPLVSPSRHLHPASFSILHFSPIFSVDFLYCFSFPPLFVYPRLHSIQIHIHCQADEGEEEREKEREEGEGKGMGRKGKRKEGKGRSRGKGRGENGKEIEGNEGEEMGRRGKRKGR